MHKIESIPEIRGHSLRRTEHFGGLRLGHDNDKERPGKQSKFDEDEDDAGVEKKSYVLTCFVLITWQPAVPTRDFAPATILSYRTSSHH
jgi:hypothetical protein